MRELIEERFFSVAVVLTIVGKLRAAQLAGPFAGLSRIQSLNAGAALVAHGELTIVVAQLLFGRRQPGVRERWVRRTGR